MRRVVQIVFLLLIIDFCTIPITYYFEESRHSSTLWYNGIRDDQKSFVDLADFSRNFTLSLSKGFEMTVWGILKNV